MQTKILLVYDEDNYRLLLKTALEEAGYKVVVAPNGRIAQSLVSIYDDFGACVSNIRLPEVDGIALLGFIVRTRPMPVILLGSSTDDPVETKALGAVKLLQKPFKKEDLINALQEALQSIDPLSSKGKMKTTPETTGTAVNQDPTQVEHPSTIQEPGDLDKDDLFCKINLQDFISGKELLFDIYIRLSAQKYIKIAHQGNTFTPESLNIYKARNIEYLYMQKEDFKKYVGFSVSLSNVVTSSPSLPKTKKIQFIKHVTEMVATQIFAHEVDEASFDNAKAVLESTLAVMSDSEELVTMLAMLNAASDSTYSHSIGVSLYSTMLAQAVGGSMASPLVLFKVCMGGMLHDIGKRELPAHILNRPKHLLNSEEVKIYESHPILGAEILGKLPFVHPDIVKIAAQHHENCLGTGYPANLKMSVIHPLARLVSVANEFCDLAIQGPKTTPLTPLEVIDNMSLNFMDTLDPVFFVTLAKLFNIEIDPSYHEAQRKTKRGPPPPKAL